MNNTELAWAAGFFDGEGSICSTARKTKHGDSYHMIVSISQTDPRPLERFRLAVGMGKVGGPYNTFNAYTKQVYKPVYAFRLHTAGEVLTMVAKLWPYLSEPKRDQMQASIEGWKASKATRKPRGYNVG